MESTLYGYLINKNQVIMNYLTKLTFALSSKLVVLDCIEINKWKTFDIWGN